MLVDLKLTQTKIIRGPNLFPDRRFRIHLKANLKNSIFYGILNYFLYNKYSNYTVEIKSECIQNYSTTGF